MATTNAGHAQQCGTVHHALDDNYHPHSRAQQTQTVETYNNGHPNDDELKIKDSLYLFKQTINGQKNLWGLVPEEEEEEMRNVKKRSDSVPTSAAARKNKRSQHARHRHRQRVTTAAARRQSAPKSLQNQYEDGFPPCCDGRMEARKFRGCRPGFRDSTMSVSIKGIEFTAVAVPHRQRSCINTEVAEGLGLCVHTVCYYTEPLLGSFVNQTFHSIPTYLGSSKQCRVSSEFDVVDMKYYDVYLGADLLPVYLKEHPNYVL
ncbi:hypothetical protein KI688_011491 [Linnemannia hyalina]|uniref:Uncharacterized protein n=1 Tax=Linnemannia hyalina TaxID=64524 RepID=A0A9P8BTQ8_9FUNG|nr:hypothetical protein KI688_011491 [Linnemannia hyalina]